MRSAVLFACERDKDDMPRRDHSRARNRCAAVWQDLCRRGNCRTFAAHSHHVADGIGLSHERSHQRGASARQRPALSPATRRLIRVVMLFLLAEVVAAGCGSGPSPDAAYAEILAKSRRGDLSAALQESDREFKRYARSQPEQAWRFRVLEAQLLVVQGKPNNALDLLRDDVPASLSTGEVAIRRKMVQGLALGFSRQFELAEADLKEAEEKAQGASPDLLLEVLQSRGTVEIEEARY